MISLVYPDLCIIVAAIIVVIIILIGYHPNWLSSLLVIIMVVIILVRSFSFSSLFPAPDPLSFMIVGQFEKNRLLKPTRN